MWELKTIKEVCTIQPPKSEARKMLKSDDLVSFIPMADLGECTKHFESHQVKSLNEVSSSYTYFAENDLILAKITPCFENGKLGIARNLKNGVGFGSSEFIVLRSKGSIDPEYLFYFLSQDTFRKDGAAVMTGAVGHKRVPKEFIEEHKIPIPPLPEQKRITAILDETLAGINAAIANTQANFAAARQLFESYLDTVLREKVEGWIETDIGQFAQTQYGISGKMNVNEDGYKIFRMGEVKNGLLVDTGKMKFINADAETVEKYRLHHEDVLFNRTNSIDHVGKTGIFYGDGDYLFASYLVRLKVDPSKINNRFLCYLMNSKAFLSNIRKKASKSVNQANINATILRNELISYPKDIKTQKEIADKLSTLEDYTKDLEDILRQRLDALRELKQSILAKAFRGELTQEEIAA